MPGGRDYNQGRPPRRKSWQGDGDQPEGRSSDSADPYYDGNGRARADRDEEKRPQIEIESNRGRRLPRLAGSYNGLDDDEDLEDVDPSRRRPSLAEGLRGSGGDSAARKKKKKKRLISLVGNEVLCLAIIFSLIAAYNWMATDYSGDFMGRNRALGQVRLAIARRDANIDAELEYGRHGFMNMVEAGSSQGSPKPDEPFTIKFIESSQWQHGMNKPWQATFVGKIDGGRAIGTIRDGTGLYKVELEKNVLTSLFRQTQSHIPPVPAVPLPSLFDEKSKQEIRGVIPVGRHN